MAQLPPFMAPQNPLQRKLQEVAQRQKILQALGHSKPPAPPAPALGVPQTSAPVPHAAAGSPFATGVGPDLSAYESQIKRYDDEINKTLAAPDPQRPQYQAPTEQQLDPKQTAIAGILGSLFLRGGGQAALVEGTAQEQQRLRDEFHRNQDLAEQSFQRGMQQYSEDVNSHDRRLQHLMQGETQAENAENRVVQTYEKARRDHALEEIAYAKLRQHAQDQALMRDKFRHAVTLDAEKLAQGDRKIAAQFSIAANHNATVLQGIGMRTDMALRVAQLGATTRLVQQTLRDTSAMDLLKARDKDAWDRMQSQQFQMTARSTGVQLMRMLNAANSPNPKQAQAAAQWFGQQLSDPNSPLALWMGQLQQNGLMGDDIAGSLMAEVESELPSTDASGNPVAQPQPVVVNNNLGGFPAYPGGAAGGAQPSNLDSIWKYWDAKVGGVTTGDTHPSVNATHPHPHDPHPHAAAAHDPVDPQTVDHIRQTFQSVLTRMGDVSPKSVERAWALTAQGINNADPHELEWIKNRVLGRDGAGAPNPKNSPLPSLP